MLTQSRLNTTTGIILLFDKGLPTIDPDQMIPLIQGIEPIQSEVVITTTQRSDGTLHAAIAWDNHRLHLIAENQPIQLNTLQNTLLLSPWSQAEKIQLYRHQAHLRCVYEGIHPNISERLIALYKVAYSLHHQNLLGVLDEEAWTCMPKDHLLKQLAIEQLQSYRQKVPTGIWTSLMIFPTHANPGEPPDSNGSSVWFCSKGHHRFGVKDFAYRGCRQDAAVVEALFAQLLAYVQQTGAVLEIGDTAEIGDRFVKFSYPPVDQSNLKSPLGVIVLEDIEASQINRFPVVCYASSQQRFYGVENN